jgi:hypothetical protein
MPVNLPFYVKFPRRRFAGIDRTLGQRFVISTTLASSGYCRINPLAVSNAKGNSMATTGANAPATIFPILLDGQVT